MSQKHIRRASLIRMHASIRITRTKDVLMLIRNTGIILIMLRVQHHHRVHEQHTRCTSIVGIG